MNLHELSRRHRRKIGMLLVLAAAAWFLAAYRDHLDRETLVTFVRELSLFWFIAGFMILPMGGFPIGVFLVLTGVRFGFAGGMAVAGSIVFFHKLAAYHLVRGWFRKPVSQWLSRAGYSIPAIRTNRRVVFTLVFTAVRGLPYFAKLYLLALTDIPAKIYFGVGAPVHILFCAFSVGVGAAVIQLDARMTTVLIVVSVVIIVGGYLLRHRFLVPPTESDEASSP